MPNSYDEIAKTLSVQAGKRGQKGRIPKLVGTEEAKEVEERPYHSFSQDREKQLLRHVATQLFHAMQIEGVPETEIQVMPSLPM